MLFFLDSNICIEYMRKSKKSAIIDARLSEHDYDDIKIPSIVLAELLHGAYKSRRVEETVNEVEDFVADFEVIKFDFVEAYMYGKIRANLERKGQLISNNDMLIAATALAYNATLITNNTQEFSRIDGLNLDDWTL